MHDAFPVDDRGFLFYNEMKCVDCLGVVCPYERSVS